MVVITLEHKKRNYIGIDIVDSEHRVFPTMQKAKKWLADNNFYYGQSPFFNYNPHDGKEWCHIKDSSWEYIDVRLEILGDQDEPSRYKDFDPGMAPWQKAAFEEGRREGYAQVLVEADIPKDVKVKKFMEHFDESEEDAEYWISECEKAGKESPLVVEENR